MVRKCFKRDLKVVLCCMKVRGQLWNKVSMKCGDM